jgi:hypothetical protein
MYRAKGVKMIREIVRPEKEQLVIDIPRDYLFKDVEILVFPINGEARNTNGKNTSKKLSEFEKLMEQAKEANIKVSKDIDIDYLIDQINNDIY